MLPNKKTLKTSFVNELSSGLFILLQVDFHLIIFVALKIFRSN